MDNISFATPGVLKIVLRLEKVLAVSSESSEAARESGCSLLVTERRGVVEEQEMVIR